ncbi:MAG: aminoacyl-tRNA hydrolase [Ruminococcus sp.]|jgi:PTH1 family peptidyl-tRNA hydrolase|nr:aminoacyl-tRNA hydrolase [Ruminococcus sp.]
MDIFKIFEQLKKPGSDTPPGKISHIIAALGNPGMEYINTRHNAGFNAADRLLKDTGKSFEKLRFKSNTADINIGKKRVLVIKPVTFMNNSGEAVAEAMNYYKIKPENVLIICDEIYLEPGLIRIRRKGSHGGHNGLKSIFELTGEENFPRIKIGIGHRPDGYNLADWVLSKFTDSDKLLMEKAYTETVEATKLIVDGQIEKAMNKYSK